MKYRKKPVEVEAIQVKSNNISEVIEALGEDTFFIDRAGRIVIKTLEGQMRANVGDWIIKGIKGEFYPCKPDIFEATYEAVE